MTATVPFALAFARHGLPVIPLHNPVLQDDKPKCSRGNLRCESPAKHPRTSHGLKDGSRDPGQIRQWWQQWPDANLGVVTGDIVALDVDPRHGGDDSLRGLESEHGELPITWRFLTGGGGEHVVFQACPTAKVANSQGRLGPGLDVRGIGGYIVAPPSQHILGRRYEISVDHHPEDVPLAPMPDWLVLKLAEAGRKAATPAPEWQALVRDGVEEGQRNAAIARLAGHLLRKNVDALVVRELVFAFNYARCRPPLSLDEINRTLDSIARRELARRSGQ